MFFFKFYFVNDTIHFFNNDEFFNLKIKCENF